MKTFFIILSLIPLSLFAQNAPQAHFGASDAKVCDSAYSENFSDQSTYNPTSWKWHFPGAIPDTSTLQNPTNIMYKGYGCYNVKLVVKNSYGSDSLTDSNYVCLDSPPNITLSGDLRVCAGQHKTYDTIYAHGGTSYLWFNGSTNSSFIFSGLLADNILNIGVTVYNGACSKDTIFPLRHDTAPAFIFVGNTSICIGDSTTIYAKANNHNYKYLWSTGSTFDSLTIDSTAPGSYNYYLTVTNGACVSDSVQITVTVNNCAGVEKYSNNSEFAVYPNPNDGTFQLEIKNGELGINNIIEVYNVLGQQVYQSKINSENTEINLSAEPQGVYLYRVITENGELVGEGKLVIEK